MMRLALSVAGLLLLAPFAGAQSKHIHEEADPYSKLKMLSLETSTHTCPGDPSRGPGEPDLHLLFVAAQNPDKTISYYITPELDGGNYKLGLRPRGTMDALIDGDGLTLTTYAGSDSVKQHSVVHETIPFSIAEADLERLSKAGTFQFRINGTRAGLQRCSDAKRLRDLAEFLGAAKAYGLPEAGSNLGARPIVEEFDPASKLKTLTLEGISTTACPGDAPLGEHDPQIHLLISANQRSDGGVWYFITTDLSHGAMLGLHRGDKIHTQVGGVSGNFNTINGSVLTSRTDLRGQPVFNEMTAFHVHQGDLVPLIDGPGLELRIASSHGELHRCAAPDQFQHLAEFVNASAAYHSSR